jgi:hypothetical protein
MDPWLLAAGGWGGSSTPTEHTRRSHKPFLCIHVVDALDTWDAREEMDAVNYASGLESVDGAARLGASEVYRRWANSYTENEGPHVSQTHESQCGERTRNPRAVALSGPASARGERRSPGP